MASEKDKERVRKWIADNPERSKAIKDKYSRRKWAEDPVAMAAKTKKYRDENPEKMRDLALRYYGITSIQFDEIYARQGGKCAICRNEIPATGSGRHLDHCHRTNVIRGILCVTCNLGLGNFKDNREALQNAVHYLEKANTGHVVADPERLNRPNAATVRRAAKKVRELGAKG